RGHFAARTVRYIPNGLSVGPGGLSDAARGDLRRSVGVGPEDFLWLHVGNFQAPKDHPNLLHAFEQVVGDRPDARLRMVGLGRPPAHVAEILARPALGHGRCAHLGERNDVPDLMQAADGLVLSSSSEGLPNVIMESLSLRTPVVSTDVGGVRELVEDRRSGILVPPGDHGALARGMLDLMSRPEDERAAMGRSGQQRILDTYDLDRVVDEWESLFASLATGRR
ncbi:MAG: glycosyltransferase, partial [Sandaracinaceae bacterium]